MQVDLQLLEGMSPYRDGTPGRLNHIPKSCSRLKQSTGVDGKPGLGDGHDEALNLRSSTIQVCIFGVAAHL